LWMLESQRGIAADFNPFDLADPFAFYSRARVEAPVFYSPEIDFWVVTRHQDVRPILRDAESFSSENAQAPYRARPAAVQEILGSALTARSGLLGTQPPDHTRLRSFINKAFTPKRVAVLEPRVRELAVGMIERMAPKGRADWVAELTYELPAVVIFILLGIPDSDVPRIKRWAQSRVLLNFGDLPVEEQLEHAHNVVAYWRYCEDLVEARFAQPGDDLPSDLVRVYQAGDQTLTKWEMAGLISGQLLAGHETTTGLLSTGLLELLDHRERWEAICADPGVIRPTVEELLRQCSPVVAVKRKATRASRIGEVDIPRGANVLLMLGSANHDEAVFDQPEHIDVQRSNIHQHLAFGHGIHYCLGAPLARLEAEVVLQELTAKLPGARLVENQDFTFSRNTTFRSPTSLIVEWT
jgi:cytochrome P450